MAAKFTLRICRFFILLLICQQSIAQNSVLVNFGSNSCSGTSPAFSLIKSPLSATPSALTDCNMAAQLPSYYSVFIAYNPLNNKIYVADVRSGLETKIWLLNMGLPSTITCPASIPTAPTYSYSYVSNNFEFDNNGDLWSFSNYNATTGQCNMDRFDVNTGNVISSRVLQFPSGNFPTTIASGDLTILPNGRMFAVLGNGTCRLYEITNYSSTTGNASAAFLRTMPKDCFGIAYLNGLLEVTGMDFGTNCYYYDYNIATGTLGTEKSFQNGQAPIDKTSLTPQVGNTKKLVSATKSNSNTADLVYEAYIENMGNVILNNINLTDDLAAAFGGAANVSNVSVSVVPGSNGANLTLNPAYNGTTVTSMLNPGQNLPNRVQSNRNYFLKLQIRCRATNLSPNVTYLNSAIAKADIGAGNLATIINVSDSSNNGDSTIVDPNKNGNAGDVGENVPTPFSFGALPVRFINVNASLQNNNAALLQWQVATPMENAANFEIEFSRDGRNWTKAGTLAINNANRGNWQFTHTDVPTGNLFYRIKQSDNDGTFAYSRVVLLKNKANTPGYVLYPNPANNFIAVSAGYDATGKATIELYDATGRLLQSRTMLSSSEEISTAQYPGGTYLLRILNDGDAVTYKVIVQH
ncbi:MAG: T9SS type A sorting domain-containing protein [Chitinophagaceae bacterium]|nr:T9SS type A sorting domain-containing protein [Chitinophagaceae bacterium]